MSAIDLQRVIDGAKFNRFHGLIVFWCAFVIIFDGYDLVIYGTVLPQLMNEWGMTPAEAGSLGSVALIGMMIGSFIFGPLADKVGRKNVILFCLALFSFFTGIIGFSTNTMQFAVYRFISGLGLGGVMPNAIALVTEYAPKKLKSTLVSIMFSGYSAGGVMAAALGLLLIEPFGWRALFFIGALPLLVLPFMYKTLPESPNYLLINNKQEKIGTILTKIEPAFSGRNDFVFKQPGHIERGVPVVQLFKNGRAGSTLLLWVAFFMCLLMIYGLNTWLPKLFDGAGLPVSGLVFLLAMNLGAIFGAIFGGKWADMWRPKPVLLIFFLTAAASLALLGLVKNLFLLYVLVAIAGATTIGTQIISNAYTSQYYPAEMRSSGVGWALGVGRLGAIAGPIIGGIALSFSLPFYQNFLVFAIPGLVGAAAMLFVQEKHAHFFVEAKFRVRVKENIEV